MAVGSFKWTGEDDSSTRLPSHHVNTDGGGGTVILSL